jgi:Tfp pilus assembly protein PilO
MTGRDRMVIVVLAVAAVLAGAWFGLVGPRRAEVSDLHQQIAAARQQRDAAVAQAAVGLAAKRAYATNAASLAELGKAVPSQDDTAALLYELQDAAGHSRVNLTSVAPGAASAALPTVATAGSGPVASLPITVSFEGNYPELQRFLRRVEDFASIRGDTIAVRGRLVTVQSIQMTRPDGADAVKATISATTYTTPAAVAPSSATSVSGTSSTAAAPTTPPTAPAAVLGANG